MTLALAALLTFVQPPPGAQVVGPSYIEVRTDATSVDRVEFTVDGVLAGVARKAPWRIAHDFGTSPAAHQIEAKLFANGYRDVRKATMSTLALTAGESVVIDLVEVPLRVRSSKQVKAPDLRIRENGIEQAIRDVKPERGAAHFVFVVDRSLSMGDGKLAAALHAIDENLNLLRPDDTASIVFFNHNVMKARPIARGDSFGDITPSGGTSLRDALASIHSNDRTYAIVITDGGDRNSELTDEEALRRISTTRTLVDAIILGDRSPFLDRATTNTGGAVMRANARTIREALHDAIADINSRYLAVYQCHGTPRGWRTIDVKGRTPAITILAARKGYFAE
ncbi:MAG TPA: VWA domain-containing protein [Thermoanaerobaculia bacterium]|jgi:Mg-chelatase subunit ChlD